MLRRIWKKRVIMPITGWCAHYSFTKLHDWWLRKASIFNQDGKFLMLFRATLAHYITPRVRTLQCRKAIQSFVTAAIIGTFWTFSILNYRKLWIWSWEKWTKGPFDLEQMLQKSMARAQFLALSSVTSNLASFFDKSLIMMRQYE